ncbi:MAG: hypothetical protein MI742_13290 [Desulfobacterales bacterium]|nr:hypothetical protein [Desulfobacterales bacterium]
MRMRFFPSFLKGLALVIVAVLILVHKGQKARVLVVHSYHTDYPWVIQINEGLARSFEKSRRLSVRHHYMDLKNHTDEDFKRTAASTAHRAISKWEPDVIIISDDLGQDLVGRAYLDHPEVGIVFCGVNGEVDAYGYGSADNVTGILERKPLGAIRETLVMMAEARGFDPGRIGWPEPRVLFICDDSDSVTAELDELNTFDWAPLKWLTPVRVTHFEAWKKAVQEAGDKADILLVSDYREFRLPSGEKEQVPPSEIMAWTETHSSLPVLGMSLVNVVDGGMMAVFTSGYEQGEVAGAMALRLIKGEKGRDIPMSQTRQFLISVRQSAMEKRDLPIPSIYESFARATENYHE